MSESLSFETIQKVLAPLFRGWGSRHDVEDMICDARLQYLQAVDRAAAAGRPVRNHRALLTTIATRLRAERLRRRVRRAEGLARHVRPAAAALPSTAVEDAELRAFVRRALRSLPEAERREVLAKARGTGLRKRAKVTKTSVATVRRHIEVGIAKLRGKLVSCAGFLRAPGGAGCRGR